MKWIFIYKSDFDDFFFKYKARIVIRDDLQKINNAQNVYAVTFALKIFRMMMIFVVDFHLKIKQLNVVNVFLNVFNDEKIYCHMSNEYGNCYTYNLFLYTYTLPFIHVHPTFYTYTPLLIKLARRHARCTRNKLSTVT